MVLHRVHHQILRSHHLFEPLNEEQMEELLNASQLLNRTRATTCSIRASRHTTSTSSSPVR